MKKINAYSGVAGGIAGLDDSIVSLDGLNEWYNCRRCSRKYAWLSRIEEQKILPNIDGSPEIAALVYHYYPEGVTLTELIESYRTGIVRRYSGRLAYILEPLALRAIYICFNYNGRRTYAVLVRKENSDTLYTVVTMEVPLA